MTSLRERAKLAEKGLIESDETRKHRLSSLPVEILLLIFDRLSARDLLSLRAVNTRLKQLIDTYERFWNCIRVRVSFAGVGGNKKSLGFSNDLEISRRLLASLSAVSFSSYNLVFINSEHFFRRKHLLPSPSCPYTIKNGSYMNGVGHLVVLFSQLNMKCHNVYLELIVGSQCRKIIIDSFTCFDHLNLPSRTSSKSRSDSIHVRLARVECLTVNFSSSSHMMTPPSSEQPRILSMLLKSFLNLTHFHLKSYSGSIDHLNSLLTSLPHLSLIDLESCDGYSDSDQNLSRHSKRLRPKTLILTNSSARFVQAYVNSINTSRMENLSLQMNPASEEFQSSCVDLIRDVFFEREYPALRCLQTNLIDYQVFDDHVLGAIGRAISNTIERVFLTSPIGRCNKSTTFCGRKTYFFETSLSDQHDSQRYDLPNDLEKLVALRDRIDKSSASHQQQCQRFQLENVLKLAMFWMKSPLSIYFDNN